MSKLILILKGSPRKNGNSAALAEQVSDGARKAGAKVESVYLAGLEINPCDACDACQEGNDGCIVQDDMQSLYSLLEEASAYVISTPVYNGNVSGQLKTAMDRCRALFSRNHKVFRYKPVIAIAVGGDRVGGQENAIQQISDFFVMNGGLPISGGTFGANLGASFWSKDSLEGVMADEEGFRSLQKTVKRLDKYIKENKQ